MSTEVRLRRGTAAQHAAFTGALAEVTVNTTDGDLHVGDGATPGGFGGKGLMARVRDWVDSLAGVTTSQIETTSFSVLRQALRTSGYASAGDGGGALWHRITAPTTPKPHQKQSADGAWWQISDVVRNVKMFGARGNGVTDDTAAFQAAHDALPANGGSIFIPTSGVGYLITAPINVSIGNTCFYGANMNSTPLIVPLHNFDVFNVTAGSTFGLHGVGFVFQGTEAPSGAYYAVNAPTNLGLSISHVKLGGAPHSGFRFTYASSRIAFCAMRNLKPGQGIGFDLRPSPISELAEITYCQIFNGDGADCYAGIMATRGGPIVISHTQLAKCGTPILISITGGVQVGSVVLDEVWCDTSSGNGMLLSTDGTSTLKRMRITNSWFSSCLRGIRITGNVHGVKITGSEIFDNASEGILVDAGAVLNGMQISDCAISGNGKTTASPGISLPGNLTSRFTISNNVIGPSAEFPGNTTTAISMGVNCDNYIITDNIVTGNTTGSITGHTANSPTKVVSGNVGFVSQNSGSVSRTPDASGDVVIAHGMAFTPKTAQVKVRGATFISAQVRTISATDLTIRLFDAAGAAVTAGGPYAMDWLAE